jgi:hypothetical protein
VGVSVIHEGHDKPVFGCDDCIKAAGPAEREGELFFVSVLRSSSSEYYVEAKSIEEARRIANEDPLDDDYFDDDEDDVYVTAFSGEPRKGEPLLTTEGDWDVIT